MKKIAVIGSEGYVGKAVVNMFIDHYEIEKYDITIKSSEDKVNDCDLAVVCVPTPMKEDGECDTSIVEDVVSWIKTPVILIKSTIKPGTTEYLKKKYKKRIVFSPELVGEGRYFMPPDVDFSQDMKVTPFQTVGGDIEDVNYVFDLMAPVLGPTKQYIKMRAIDAECAKYFENYFLGLKVIFANDMKEICKTVGADYYNVRESWLADPRVSKFHAIVFPGKEGFSGKCLPKDLNALYKISKEQGYDSILLKGLLEANKEIRKRHNLPLDY